MVRYNQDIDLSNADLGEGIDIVFKDYTQHFSIVRGITTALRLSMSNKAAERNNDPDKIVALVDLLEALLPDEWGFERAFSDVEKPKRQRR